MNIPANLKYSTDHEWVKKGGSRYLIGITDFAQNELGEIVYVDVETEGETIEQGEVFGSIEAVKTVAELMMPLSGKVVELNPALEEEPELVNSDPYGKGWIIAVEEADDSQFEALMDADAYKAMIG